MSCKAEVQDPLGGSEMSSSCCETVKMLSTPLPQLQHQAYNKQLTQENVELNSTRQKKDLNKLMSTSNQTQQIVQENCCCQSFEHCENFNNNNLNNTFYNCNINDIDENIYIFNPEINNDYNTNTNFRINNYNLLHNTCNILKTPETNQQHTSNLITIYRSSPTKYNYFNNNNTENFCCDNNIYVTQLFLIVGIFLTSLFFIPTVVVTKHFFALHNSSDVTVAEALVHQEIPSSSWVLFPQEENNNNINNNNNNSNNNNHNKAATTINGSCNIIETYKNYKNNNKDHSNKNSSNYISHTSIIKNNTKTTLQTTNNSTIYTPTPPYNKPNTHTNHTYSLNNTHPNNTHPNNTHPNNTHPNNTLSFNNTTHNTTKRSRYTVLDEECSYYLCQQHCHRSFGAHLVHVNSIREQVFLEEFIERVQKAEAEGWVSGYWLGAKKRQTSGMQDCLEGSWEWVGEGGEGVGEKSKVVGVVDGWAAFIPGKPDNYYGDENCLMMSRRSGLEESKYLKWDDVPCNANFDIFGPIKAICELETNT